MSHAKSLTFSTAIKKQKRLSKESNIYAVEKELHGRPKTIDLKVPVQKFSKDSIIS